MQKWWLCLAVLLQAGSSASAAPLADTAAPLADTAAPLADTAAPLADTARRTEVIEFRESTTRIDVAARALIAEETDPSDAPGVLAFRPDASIFRPVAGPADLNRGFTRSAVWLCTTVRNAAPSRSWILAVGPSSADSVTVYVVSPDGAVETRTEGLSRPASETRRALSDFVFRLTLGPGEAKTVYIRYASEDSLRIRAVVWESFEYVRAASLDSGSVGVLLGVVLAIFIYTLFIVISLRERSYSFYLVYLLGLFFYVLWANGVGAAVILRGLPWINRRATPFFAAIMFAGFLSFSRSYLETRTRIPALDRVMAALTGAVVPFALSLFLFDFQSVMKLVGSLNILSLLVVLAVAFASVATGLRRAPQFLLAQVFLVLGAIAAQMGTQGFADPSLDLLWSKGEQVGALAQVLLLSVGISETVNEMRVQKEEGQRRSISLLERANKVKEDFLIGSSLELRTPLHGIVGLADRLASLAVGRPEETRLSQLVRAEAARLLVSVGHVTTYARLRNGDVALVSEPFSLAEAVSGALYSTAHLAAGRGIAIERSIQDARVVADSRAFQQIVETLVAGALRRCPSGSIRIEARQEGKSAVVSVSDPGPPMPDEILERFRSAGGLEALGPGLDLLVTRLLAELLGGKLDYRAQPGRNAFVLDLPLSPVLALAGDGHPQSSRLLREDPAVLSSPLPDLSETPSGPTRRGSLLVFDEEPVFLEVLKRKFEDRGYAVTPAANPSFVVGLALSGRLFDLALIDATGPGKAGFEACARIRASTSPGALPLLLLTDRESVEAVSEAFRAGASDCLPKLASMDLLFARVDSHVALKRAAAEAEQTRKRIAEFERLKTLGVLSAGVAHEINTPNNAIIRNLPVLSEIWKELSPVIQRLETETGGFSIRGWSSSELFREVPAILADTYSAGTQIKKIVDDLKDYAREGAGSRMESVDLFEVAAYAARLLKPAIDRTTSRFRMDARPPIPRALGDFRKLTQVVVNVLENSLQSLADPDAAIVLEVRGGDGRAIVECRDEGCGMDESVVARVFEPFFTTKGDAGGTGLGLPVAQGIVKDHGGDITIISAPDRGTTVRVSLPAMEREEARE
jgi:signal transduction histidine kinase